MARYQNQKLKPLESNVLVHGTEEDEYQETLERVDQCKYNLKSLVSFHDCQCPKDPGKAKQDKNASDVYHQLNGITIFVVAA